MNVILVLFIVLGGEVVEIKKVSNHNTYLSCHAEKSKLNVNDTMIYKCLIDRKEN